MQAQALALAQATRTVAYRVVLSFVKLLVQEMHQVGEGVLHLCQLVVHALCYSVGFLACTIRWVHVTRSILFLHLRDVLFEALQRRRGECE